MRSAIQCASVCNPVCTTIGVPLVPKPAELQCVTWVFNLHPAVVITTNNRRKSLKLCILGKLLLQEHVY